MKFIESFNAIVANHKLDDYTKSISFMKSLGLKCDCVGWTTITLDSNEKFELLHKMREKADKENIKLRCSHYMKEYIGQDSEWFCFTPKISVKCDDYEWDEGDYDTCTIKGYKLPKQTKVVNIAGLTGVSQSFVDACKELKLTGVDFMWVKDKGRFKAPAYYYILPEKTFLRYLNTYEKIHNKATSKTNANYKSFILNCRQIDSDGSHMEELATLFDNFEHPNLPEMIDKNNEPKTDFAYLDELVLIRKTAAEKLISKGVLAWHDLTPTLYFDNKKHSRLICTCSQNEYMPEFIKINHQQSFEKWKLKSYPPFNPKEKDALSLMRKVKKESPEYYNKALKKSILETLSNSPFALMMPYYKISNGCSINNEIDIFSYEDVAEETALFFSDLLTKEWLSKDIPDLEDAIVFGIAANGDKLLLRKDSSVMRYNHEDPYLSETWDSLHAFFYDQIEIME